MKAHACFSGAAVMFMIVAGVSFAPGISSAHCDTMDGPVVADARKALDRGDVLPVLKWVRKSDEDGIRAQFQRTLIARKQGKESKELADRYFFETLVRIHRAGEGAPYTGLKHEPPEPIIQAADHALDTGSAEQLVQQVTGSAAAGIRERFVRAREAGKRADKSVDDGRDFVAAYVEFTHYVERLHEAVRSGGHHAVPAQAEGEGPHHH